jgi:hypothetical protein
MMRLFDCHIGTGVETQYFASLRTPPNNILLNIKPAFRQFIIIPDYPVVISALPGKFDLVFHSKGLYSSLITPYNGAQISGLWSELVTD